MPEKHNNRFKYLAYVSEDDFTARHTESNGMVKDFIQPYFNLEGTIIAKDAEVYEKGAKAFCEMLKRIERPDERNFLKREVARYLFKYSEELDAMDRSKSDVITRLGVDETSVIYYYRQKKLRREVSKAYLLNPKKAKKYMNIEEKLLLDTINDEDMVPVFRNGVKTGEKAKVSIREKMAAAAKLTAPFSKSIEPPSSVIVNAEKAEIDMSKNKIQNINFDRIRGNGDPDVIKQIREMNDDDNAINDLKMFED